MPRPSRRSLPAPSAEAPLGHPDPGSPSANLDLIRVKRAREHNLKDVSVSIPRQQLTVVCGVSGSGKSSLAFDTIFAEGQRRYVESLSSYARQFLGQVHKPDVDSIEGLSPAVAIDQKTRSSNPRSTVGTITEVYDYLRVLFARAGVAVCPHDGSQLGVSSPSQAAARALDEWGVGAKVVVLAPVVRGRKGEFAAQLSQAAEAGFGRVRVNGVDYPLPYEGPALDKRRSHHISVVVDRLVLKDSPSSSLRLVQSIESALSYTADVAFLELTGSSPAGTPPARLTISSGFSCPTCGEGFLPLEPRSFSFNSPYGACLECDGLGEVFSGVLDLIVPDPSLSLSEGAVAPWSSWAGQYQKFALSCMAHAEGIDMGVAFADLPQEHRDMVIEGTSTEYQTRWQGSSMTVRYEGVLSWLRQRHSLAESSARAEHARSFMRPSLCEACGGSRLAQMPSQVRFAGKTLPNLTAMPAAQLHSWLSDLDLPDRVLSVAGPLVREITERVSFLVDVGLGYLSLDRAAASLSGGEAQRIRLASQVGAALAGVLYVLDEPSIGLHPSDNLKLIASLHRLRDLGNTVLVVEHDEDTIFASDFVVEIGPGAGVEGGELVYAGPPAGLLQRQDSLTGGYLSGRLEVPTPRERRSSQESILLEGVYLHNLKGVDVGFPRGCITVVTGPSGSGKSSLVVDTLLPALSSRLSSANVVVPKMAALHGIDGLERVVSVDQAPIGRTPRSNAATYTGLFDKVRALFAATPQAQALGFSPGRFSFNVAGGRCEQCKGEGQLRIEMHFLPDVFVECEACSGTRFTPETLSVKFKGASVADVLAMSASQAREFFAAQPPIARQLQTLVDVGLGYLPLGHPATQLSGGEAQRVKLASELQRRVQPSTVYILDEPTTGLHFADVAKLVEVLHRLADAGATVVVIEHNLDVVRQADWVIDMGPGGGPQGGRVRAAGTPEKVARGSSPTASFIKAALKAHPPS